jgi:hypothetical protein
VYQQKNIPVLDMLDQATSTLQEYKRHQEKMVPKKKLKNHRLQ